MGGPNIGATNCMPTYDNHDIIKGGIPGYYLNGSGYDSVIVHIDYSDMSADFPGYGFIFNMQQGLLKSYKIDPKTNSGYSWELIQ